MSAVESIEISDPNDAKASFDEIYVKDDPRDYFSVLGSLDYSIPDLAKPIIRQIVGAWRKETGRAATVLDLGASYGINAALFRHPLTFDMLRRRYGRREMLQLPSAELRALDAHYYKSWPRAQAERIIVADVSAPAIRYAREVGLADAGITFDFETGAPPPADVARTIGEADIVFSTGCVGYVTERTFGALLDAAREPPWVVSFVLRMFDYEPIADRLAQAGLVTEKLTSAAFVQRRFRDSAEAAQVLDVLATRGIDPAGLESEGLLFAELFVSRPPDSVKRMGLDEMVTVANGRNMTFGARLLQLNRNGRAELVRARA